MSKISVEADSFSSKVIKLFLLLQIAAMVFVVGLSLSNLSFWASCISVLTLVIFLALLLWLYARYRELPLVRERREVHRLVRRFQKTVQAEGETLQQTMKQREILSRSEHDEIQGALAVLQYQHIENGLAVAHVDEADIPGLERGLKDQLTSLGVVSAAQVNEKMSRLPGFGEAAHRALLDWRKSIQEQLESSKPQALPPEQLEAIGQKYQPLQDRYEFAERKALASKQILEHELIAFRPRLEQLASVTFLNYLSNLLASRGLVAALLAFGLIGAQVVSSVSATAASLAAFLPTATATPSRTLTPTLTPEPTQTLTSTLTATPRRTATTAPTRTATLPPAATTSPLPTLLSSDTPIIPISGVQTNVICDPAYPGVCIPPPPPDLDCGEVPYRNFQVLPSDPHHFDRDQDGIGCEG